MSEPFIIPGETDIIFTEGDPGDVFLKQVVEPVLAARDDLLQAQKERRCIKAPIGCGRVITDEQFAKYSPLDKKEYGMSGWCLPCQDKTFKDPDAPETCPPNCKHDGEEGCLCTCDNPCCEVDVGVGIITCQGQHCHVHGGGA